MTELRVNAAKSTTLRITEIFLSLQGEANTVGYPTVFVRLTGCPLRCQYCDSAYAFKGGSKYTVADILQKVVDSFDPLPPSKSMRNSHFIVNVALEDISLANTIKEFGGLEIQRTFLLP